MIRSFHLAALAPVVLLLCVGCSESVPPAHTGAFWVVFNPGGGSCGVVGHQALVGEVSGTTLTKLEQDTVEGARIFCSVKQSGDKFNLEAYAAKGTNTLQLVVAGISKAATETDWIAGSVVFSSADSQNAYNSPPTDPCHFYFLTDPQRNSTGAGKIWLSFNCPVVEYASGGSQCTLGPSHAAFDLCDE